mmetsp:Transcript_29507/g.74239  ORF Transcript_29507/g.74239 Transcript_29507/m.74239 type:complete len:205 (+) Transcript_29507:191-805(+)
MVKSREPMPPTGTRSHPDTNSKNFFRCSSEKDSSASQNHVTTGEVGVKLPAYFVVLLSSSISMNGLPHTNSSNSSWLKRRRAGPWHTAENPRANAENADSTESTSSHFTYRATNSSRLTLVTGRSAPSGRSACVFRPPTGVVHSNKKVRQNTSSTSPSKSRSCCRPLPRSGSTSLRSSRVGLYEGLSRRLYTMPGKWRSRMTEL